MSKEAQNQVRENENLELIDITTLLLDYLRILRIMCLRVFLLMIAGAVICCVKANASYQPWYTASATFTINIRVVQQDGTNSNTSFFDNSAAEQMAKTFPYILTSGVLQRRVANAMGSAYVPGVISASVAPDTNLLTISVRDVDGERAYGTLQAVVEN